MDNHSIGVVIAVASGDARSKFAVLGRRASELHQHNMANPKVQVCTAWAMNKCVGSIQSSCLEIWLSDKTRPQN